MSKKFGQNFMIDKHARMRLASLAAPMPGQRVWEIGPGIGALTVELLGRGAEVTAFEIDHGFCRILRDEAFGDEQGFSLVEGDFLKTWAGVFREQGAPDILVSNLPYNVGSICIARVLEALCFPRRMVFTLQSEVAQRLSAEPGSKQWSSLSLLAQLDYVPEVAFSIAGSCFYPSPNVTSSAIVLERRKESLLPAELRPVFQSISRLLFSKKRKTIRNNLSSLPGIGAMIEEAGISPSERAENLTASQVVSLCRAVYRNGVSDPSQVADRSRVADRVSCKVNCHP